MSENEQELEQLVSSLRSIAERLAELSIAELKHAIERGETSRPNTERVLSRARAGLERVAGLLDGLTRKER